MSAGLFEKSGFDAGVAPAFIRRPIGALPAGSVFLFFRRGLIQLRQSTRERG
ncbi:hypothetical protein KKC1_26250 [Calderihabitans maritimus]|uniref:Uncharacterized protein n=1 Tax=Calderihabitans maritimus TaxID=1246530 RepID=A0A1Z5HVC7_9FIRM|nr:hypothetical protein KKC1_26250 [Calderihabitans maritimus]